MILEAGDDVAQVNGDSYGALARASATATLEAVAAVIRGAPGGRGAARARARRYPTRWPEEARARSAESAPPGAIPTDEDGNPVDPGPRRPTARRAGVRVAPGHPATTRRGDAHPYMALKGGIAGLYLSSKETPPRDDHGSTPEMYFVQHAHIVVISSTPAGLLDGLGRFPRGRFPVYQAVHKSLWAPAVRRAWGVAIHHGDGRIELVPDDPAPAGRGPGPYRDREDLPGD